MFNLWVFSFLIMQNKRTFVSKCGTPRKIFYLPMSVKKQIWLINTLRANPSGLTLGELSALWQDSDLNDGRPLSRTTLFRLRDAVLSAYGLLIECSRHNGARYYISNPTALNRPTIRNWMLSTLTVSHLLEDSLSLKDRILLENIPSNDATLQLVLTAMKERHRLQFAYRKYTDSNQPNQSNQSDWFNQANLSNQPNQPIPPNNLRLVEPYALKLSQQRWYLLGHNPTRPERPYSVYSLDRILAPSLSSDTFRFPSDFDAQAYFADTFGVMRDERIAPAHITLRAYGTAPAYLRDLPLHASQRLLQSTSEYSDFTLFLRPTPDFLNALMSFGPAIQVLAPQSLVLALKSRLRDTLRRYQ